MFLFWKIIAYIFWIALPAAALIRDWKYHDRRTKQHHNITRAILVGWLLCALSSIGLLLYESSGKSRLQKQVESLYSESQKKPLFRLFINQQEVHEADTLDIPIHNELAHIELAIENIGSGSASELHVHLWTPSDIGKLDIPERWHEERTSLAGEEGDTKNSTRRHFAMLSDVSAHPGTLLHLHEFKLQHATQETVNIPLMVRTSASGGHRQQWKFIIRPLP